MVGVVFLAWLIRFHKSIVAKDPSRKILLLIDNAPSHTVVYDCPSLYPSICLLPLPPNSTSVTQPMDAGIIAVFKHYYHTFAAIKTAELRLQFADEEFEKRESEIDNELSALEPTGSTPNRGLRVLKELKKRQEGGGADIKELPAVTGRSTSGQLSTTVAREEIIDLTDQHDLSGFIPDDDALKKAEGLMQKMGSLCDRLQAFRDERRGSRAPPQRLELGMECSTVAAQEQQGRLTELNGPKGWSEELLARTASALGVEGSAAVPAPLATIAPATAAIEQQRLFELLGTNRQLEKPSARAADVRDVGDAADVSTEPASSYAPSDEAKRKAGAFMQQLRSFTKGLGEYVEIRNDARTLMSAKLEALAEEREAVAAQKQQQRLRDSNGPKGRSEELLARTASALGVEGSAAVPAPPPTMAPATAPINEHRPLGQLSARLPERPPARAVDVIAVGDGVTIPATPTATALVTARSRQAAAKARQKTLREASKTSNLSNLDGFRLVARAWNSVTPQTIQGCFRHVPVMPDDKKAELSALGADDDEVVFAANGARKNILNGVYLDDFRARDLRRRRAAMDGLSSTSLPTEQTVSTDDDSLEQPADDEEYPWATHLGVRFGNEHRDMYTRLGKVTGGSAIIRQLIEIHHNKNEFTKHFIQMDEISLLASCNPNDDDDDDDDDDEDYEDYSDHGADDDIYEPSRWCTRKTRLSIHSKPLYDFASSDYSEAPSDVDLALAQEARRSGKVKMDPLERHDRLMAAAEALYDSDSEAETVSNQHARFLEALADTLLHEDTLDADATYLRGYYDRDRKRRQEIAALEEEATKLSLKYVR